MDQRIIDLLFALMLAGGAAGVTWLAGRRKSNLDGDTALVALCDALQKQVAQLGRELMEERRARNAREAHLEDIYRAMAKLPDDARQHIMGMLHTQRPNHNEGSDSAAKRKAAAAAKASRAAEE